MKKYVALKQFLSLICGTLLLSACALPPYQQANDRIDQTDRQIAADKIAEDERAAPVISRPGYYVDTHPVTFSQDPAWMRRSVTMTAQNMPLDELVSRLLRNSDANVRYDDTVQPKRLVSLHYSGSVKGALEPLLLKLDITIQSKDNVVSWSAYQTKMFDISFMPGYSSLFGGPWSK